MSQLHLSDLKKGQVWGTNYGLLSHEKARVITWVGTRRIRYRPLYPSGKEGATRGVLVKTFRKWLKQHASSVVLLRAAP